MSKFILMIFEVTQRQQTQSERIVELEGFIRKHTCERCDAKTIFADECKKCPAYGVLRGGIWQ